MESLEGRESVGNTRQYKYHVLYHHLWCGQLLVSNITIMHFAIWTTNKPKSEAIEYVLNTCPYTVWQATFSNHKALSWVPDMPTSLEELRTWAKNRAIATRNESPDADYFVGMEGWVYHDALWEEYWYVWIVYIEDRDGKWNWGYSGHLRVPSKVVDLLFDGRNLDLEQVMHELMGAENVGDKQGSGAVWSDGFLTRQEQFTIAAKCAIVPLFSKYYQ
jgi:inosine/xanthosine triphosphatase